MKYICLSVACDARMIECGASNDASFFFAFVASKMQQTLEKEGRHRGHRFSSKIINGGLEESVLEFYSSIAFLESLDIFVWSAVQRQRTRASAKDLATRARSCLLAVGLSSTAACRASRKKN